MPAFRTIFIGDSSLLIRCAASTLLAGGDIVALVTKNARVESWALEHGISVLNKGNDIGSYLASLDFDYLFSVGHLNIIAADVLRRARKMTVNFHDGPLPRYAGLNAPSWAIRNGETRHGVAWHEMIERPDAGRIVASADITIEPDDTALSLNAKCYEAGFACFEEILEAIKSDALRLEPQVGKRSYFSRSKRPPAAATLDLAQPAHVIAAQVRALHFGPYANPLGFAKLYAGDQLLLVGNAVEAPELGRSDAPGTVLAVEADSVVVATGTNPIRLENLRSVEGTPIASASDLACFEPGRALIPVLPELIERIDALNQRSACGEGYWSDALRRACAVDLPFPHARTRAAGPTHHRFQLSAPHDVDSRITAILAWATKVASIDRVSMVYRSGVHDRDIGEAALWFSRWRPLSIDLDANVAIEDAVGAVSRGRRQRDGCFARCRRDRDGDVRRGRSHPVSARIQIR
jgi:methionyl-tRNA formyltransferase